MAATLLSLVPATALPFGWSALAGLQYQRGDSWVAGAPRDSQPSLNVGVQLSLHDEFFSPGMLGYAGNVGYARATASSNGSQTQSGTSLVYSLQAHALGHPSSPLSLSGFASRTDSRTQDYLSANGIGDETTTSYGATMTVHGSGTPAATLGFTRLDMHQALEAVLDHDKTLTSFTGSVTQGSGPFTLSGNYRGDFSDGTWVADQYQAHTANVSGSSKFSADSDLTLNDSYYRRIPTMEQAGSFASEINSFVATYRNGYLPGHTSTLGYFDSRALTTLDAVSEQTMSNSLRYKRDQQLPAPEFFLQFTGDFSTTSQRRTGAGSLDASGATAGAQLWWYRTIRSARDIGPGMQESWQYDLAAGPLVSYLDPTAGPVEMGYGASAHGRIGIPVGRRRISCLYDIMYGNDLYAQAGWALSQTGNVGVSGPAGPGGYDVGLSFVATRREAPVLGPSASRSLSAIGGYHWRRHAVVAQAQLSNGTLPGTSAFVGDGLFIPTGFATRDALVSVQASTSLASGFSARIDGRYHESVNPGQPSTSGWDAGAALAWRYAAFDISIDDRLSWYDVSGGRYLRNVVFLRISRSIGSGR